MRNDNRGRSMGRSWVMLIPSILLVAVALPALGSEGSQSATPAAGSPAVISRVFGEASPVAVEDPVLAVAVVTVEPSAVIPPHVHVGTQIGTIDAGELTYTVLSGQVVIRRGADGPGAQPEPVSAGETVLLGVGDTVIENPGAAHQARNDGDEAVVIWLSTLFPDGAPRSEPVEATPAP